MSLAPHSQPMGVGGFLAILHVGNPNDAYDLSASTSSIHLRKGPIRKFTLLRLGRGQVTLFGLFLSPPPKGEVLEIVEIVRIMPRPAFVS